MGSDYLSGRPLEPHQPKEFKLPKWPPGLLAHVRQQGACQSFCCPQSPRDCWNMDNAGLFVLIFMGKGIGPVFPYGVSGLSFNIISKQPPLCNNLGGVGVFFYSFIGSSDCYAKPYHSIPGNSFRSRMTHLDPYWNTMRWRREPILPEMRGHRARSMSFQRDVQILPSGELVRHLVDWEHTGSQAVFLATFVS